MKYELPKLPYDYDALEPYLDARTMELHHGKHHAGYVVKLNAALEKNEDIAKKPLEGLLADTTQIPEDIREAVRNNGGGHFNHSLFWETLSPEKEEPQDTFLEAVNKEFGDVASFQKQFTEAALGVFGSGWAWLIKTKNEKLEIVKTKNQDTPLNQGSLLLNLDVWEHAYYLKYQNRRPEYIEAWWSVVNWKKVAERFSRSLK